MKDLTTQYELASKYHQKGYISSEMLESFKTTGNKGVLGECRLVDLLKIKNYTFNNDEGADIVYRGLRIQFKFNGSGSSASVTEIVRQPNETKEEHVNSILKHYKDIDEYWIVTTNNLLFNKNDIHCYDKLEFKEILLKHNCKINLKIRLKKGIIERFNKDNY